MAILGLGAGKMELRLNRTELHPLDMVEGTATLSMNAEAQAHGVVAEFWAQIQRGSGKHRHTEILHRQEKRLDGERNYSQYEGQKQYAFTFQIPQGILMQTPRGNDFVGGIFGWLEENRNNSVEWYVSVKLDIPMAFDVSAKQQLRVTLAPQMQSGMQ